MEKSTAISVLRIQLEKLNEFKPGGRLFTLNYEIELNYFPPKNNGKVIRKKYCESPFFISWEIGTIAVLNNIFGPTNEDVRRFKSIEYDKYFIASDELKELDYAIKFLSGVDKAEKLIYHFIQELEN